MEKAHPLVFSLLHSPLVGPSTWKPVARVLEGTGIKTIVPDVTGQKNSGQAFWKNFADSAAGQINAFLEGACILVGHSGAGPVLPAVGMRLSQMPEGYIFVDAGLPQQDASRLDMLRTESAAQAARLEKHLLTGGRYPEWSDADLVVLIPDPGSRRLILGEIQPQMRDYFTERIQIPSDWSRTPCGYVQFSETYDKHAGAAESYGWPVIRIQAGHFHMLVDPVGVARALVDIANQLMSRHT